MLGIWLLVATPGASLFVGIVCLALLCRRNGHRESDGSLSRTKISNAVMLSAAFYTMIILIIGQFFVGAPVSKTIAEGFGDGRIAWLIVVLALDTGMRIWSLFDPKSKS